MKLNWNFILQRHLHRVNGKLFSLSNSTSLSLSSGSAFADSVLDCILSCVCSINKFIRILTFAFVFQAYYNDNAVNLLRNVLTGGVDLQLEEILAEGGGFTQCESNDILKKRNRARVALLEIRELIPDIETRVKGIEKSEQKTNIALS